MTARRTAGGDGRLPEAALRFLQWLLRMVLRRLDRGRAALLLSRLAAGKAHQLGAPAEALRFLFDLETRLYPLQGKMAVAYGGGLHTKHRHMRYHDFFVDRVSPPERVLDVGCGLGAVAHDVAARTGCRVVAVDLDPANIAKASQRHAHEKVTYLAGDVLKDLPGGGFDAVILSNVLEHLPDRSRFLQRLVRVTGAKRVLVRVPLFERDWRVPLKRELGVEWRLDATHETEYTLESFAAEMDRAGMRPVHLEVRWGEIWSEVVAHEA